MKEIKTDKLVLIEGGIDVSGAVINSFTTGIKIILELGRSLGSVLRRGSTGNMCSIWLIEY